MPKNPAKEVLDDLKDIEETDDELESEPEAEEPEEPAPPKQEEKKAPKPKAEKREEPAPVPAPDYTPEAKKNKEEREAKSAGWRFIIGLALFVGAVGGLLYYRSKKAKGNEAEADAPLE